MVTPPAEPTLKGNSLLVPPSRMMDLWDVRKVTVLPLLPLILWLVLVRLARQGVLNRLTRNPIWRTLCIWLPTILLSSLFLPISLWRGRIKELGEWKA